MARKIKNEGSLNSKKVKPLHSNTWTSGKKPKIKKPRRVPASDWKKK